MSSKDIRVRSRSWFFWADIQIGRTVDGLYQTPSDVVLGLFRDPKHEDFRSISLPSLHTISFSVPASSDGNLLCGVSGFIRGPLEIAESAVRGWIPDSSGNHFEWTPIHGHFEKHALIKTFFSEIACNLKTRHYVSALDLGRVSRRTSRS